MGEAAGVGGQAGLWWGVARLGYRRYSAYRAATLGGLFTNTVFGFMRSYVLLAVLREAGPIGGYDATDAVTYVWLTQGLMNIVALWGWDLISARVRTGEIASDLTRPADFQAWWLAHDLGRAWYHSVTRAIVPLAVGLAFFDIRLPASAGQVAAFLVSVVLAVGVSFAMRFIVELSAFWWLDANGARVTYGLLQTTLSGFTVPLAFISGFIGAFVGVLPFAASMQIPIDIFLGNHRAGAQLFALGLQVFWLVTLLAVGRFVFAAATRRLVLQGG